MRWANWAKLFLVLFLLVVVSLCSCYLVIAYDEKMTQIRGYGLVCLGRPAAPFDRARNMLWEIKEFCLKYLPEHEGVWPDPETLVANIPDLVLDKEQPYKDIGIYVLKTEITNQWFLYSDSIAKSKDMPPFGIIHGGKYKWIVYTIAVCVMSTREVGPDMYRPYNDYPKALVEILGEDAWKTWYLLTRGENLVFCVKSTIPPVPGCYSIDKIPGKIYDTGEFYYTKDTLAALKAIYPNVQVPKEQILTDWEMPQDPNSESL